MYVYIVPSLVQVCSIGGLLLYVPEFDDNFQGFQIYKYISNKKPFIHLFGLTLHWLLDFCNIILGSLDYCQSCISLFRFFSVFGSFLVCFVFWESLCVLWVVISSLGFFWHFGFFGCFSLLSGFSSCCLGSLSSSYSLGLYYYGLLMFFVLSSKSFSKIKKL